MRSGRGRRKVAIIGGGISGLTAAYELTRTPELRRRFEVTVHEASFRLGGKLASGRNRQQHLRSEEHGLHVWFGCYENAFRMAREVFASWEAPRGAPIRSVEDAFVPHDFTPFGDEREEGGEVRLWDFHCARDADAPGLGGVSPSILGVLTRLLDGAVALLSTQLDGWGLPGARQLPRLAFRPPGRAKPPAGERRLRALLGLLVRTLGRLGKARRFTRVDARRLRAVAVGMREAALALLSASGDGSRRLEIMVRDPLDFVLTVLAGVLDPRFGIFEDGDLDRINHLDLRDWLLENGAERDTVEGPHVRMLYDLSFQYEGGEVARPLFEAGTALRIFLRLALTYKGAALYLVRGGMGETFLSPLYEVLVARGVRFAFSESLARMDLSADRSRVERLQMVREVRTNGVEPAPTFLHEGLVCWPATRPDGAIERHPVTLRRGCDFDDVVLALPAGVMASRPGAPSPCEALLSRTPRLRALFDRMNLVPTLAVQLWVDRDLAGLGWNRPPPAVVGCGRPLDVWVDMSHVLDFEPWPRAARPRGLHYFCGVLPPGARNGDAATAARLVAAQLERRANDIWPLAREAGGGFDWSVLHDPEGRTGPRRLEAQYVHANVAPTDLCDGSVPGTAELRPESHESGLENLALAGTWTRTSFNTTCVEAAIMAGMSAARAVAGEGREIIGEGFLRGAPVRGVLPRSRLEPRVSTDAPESVAVIPQLRSNHGVD